MGKMEVTAMKVALRKPRHELADKIERDCKDIYRPQSGDYMRFRAFIRALRGSPIDFSEARITAGKLPEHYEWHDEVHRLMLVLGEPAQEKPFPWSIEAAVSNPILADARACITDYNKLVAEHNDAFEKIKRRLEEIIRAARLVPRTKQDDWYREALGAAEYKLEQLQRISCLDNLTDLTEIH